MSKSQRPEAAVAIATIAVLMVPLAACAEPPVDETRVRAVYAAKDLPLEIAHLWRPAPSAGGTAGELAPLLIQQANDPTATKDDDPFGEAVYYFESTCTVQGRELQQWTYVWTYPSSPPERPAPLTQGVRLTVGQDGFPLTYEVLHDSSGSRLFFVEASLEEAAAEQFGPLPYGRRFVIERPLEETPEVFVPAIVEPGATPLGPFVYLFDGSHDVDTIVCRCQPSQVSEIRGNAEYRLLPLTAAEIDRLDPPTRSWLQSRDGTSLERLLRWPD